MGFGSYEESEDKKENLYEGEVEEAKEINTEREKGDITWEGDPSVEEMLEKADL